MRARQCKPCKHSQLPELESSSTRLVRIADMREAATVGGLFFCEEERRDGLAAFVMYCTSNMILDI
jgi:hypothetical protein